MAYPVDPVICDFLAGLAMRRTRAPRHSLVETLDLSLTCFALIRIFAGACMTRVPQRRAVAFTGARPLTRAVPHCGQCFRKL
jgi:hypothetical protein